MNTHTFAFATLVAVLMPHAALASAKGVGLGVAGGVAYSGSHPHFESDVIGARFAWGFYVDIPLVQDTFYITPTTTVYEMNADGTNRPVTDVDLNFKFIVPLHRLKIGAGLGGGLSVGIEDNYVPHWNLLGLASWNIASNLDLFTLAQYKRLMPELRSDITDIHLFGGVMFYF